LRETVEIKAGDIVEVRLKQLPEVLSIGIVVRDARRMYMVGEMIEVLVDGKIFYASKDHVRVIE